MNKRDVLLWTVVVCSFLHTPCASAQTATSGAIVGTVTDQTGAVVPKAEVQVVNIDTNATQTQTTTDSGQYVFPSLAPGNYKLTVAKTGFHTSTVTGLTV